MLNFWTARDIYRNAHNAVTTLGRLIKEHSWPAEWKISVRSTRWGLWKGQPNNSQYYSFKRTYIKSSFEAP